MPDFKIRFGKHLKQLRRTHGLTQDQLAERLDVSKDTIKNYEKGRYGPEFVRLPAIARALGVAVRDLFAFEHESRPDARPDW